MQWIIAALLAVCVTCGASGFARALTLDAPKDGAVLHSGEKVPVVVRPEDTANFREVRYFWLRTGEESVAVHRAAPALFQPADPKRPIDGMLTVPQEGLGLMRLLAVGEVVAGRLAGQLDFDEVVVQVEPSVRLMAIEFAVEKPWRLNQLGKRLPVPAMGQFEDGTVRPLGGQGTGSGFRSSDDRVVQVDQMGDLVVTGRGRASITVMNRRVEGILDVVVESDDEPNRFPMAGTPATLTANPGSVVVLDGRQSRDPDGDPLHFEWKQTRGLKVDLTTPNEVRTTFVAPHVSARRLLQFQLQVTDLKGPDTVKGADSVPAVVDVWIEP